MTQTTNPTRPVQVPAGVERVSEWEHDEPMPRRYSSRPATGVQGHDLVVWWDATQFTDVSAPSRRHR